MAGAGQSLGNLALGNLATKYTGEDPQGASLAKSLVSDLVSLLRNRKILDPRADLGLALVSEIIKTNNPDDRLVAVHEARVALREAVKIFLLESHQMGSAELGKIGPLFVESTKQEGKLDPLARVLLMMTELFPTDSPLTREAKHALGQVGSFPVVAGLADAIEDNSSCLQEAESLKDGGTSFASAIIPKLRAVSKSSMLADLYYGNNGGGHKVGVSKVKYDDNNKAATTEMAESDARQLKRLLAKLASTIDSIPETASPRPELMIYHLARVITAASYVIPDLRNTKPLKDIRSDLAHAYAISATFAEKRGR